MNLKKFTQKNADGSSFTYEFDVPKMQGIPDHPGEPKGTDTVPAWLTPGEFVVNAEATRMFEPQIEAMNEAGRAVQRAQGGTIPEYHNDGGIAGDLTMVPRSVGGMDARMQELLNLGYTPKQIEAAIGKLGNIGLLTDDLAASLARTKNANQLSVQDKGPQMSLEDLAMSKLPQVQQESMPSSKTPELNFRGQMPPVSDDAEIVKDALGNQRDFLNERYGNEDRQKPAVPVSGIGTDLDIPDPNRPPMNVPSSFKDNLGFNPLDYIPDISLEGATEKLGSLFESMPDWMKTESSINQQQRARDLTPTGKANVIDTDFEYIGTDTPGKFALQPTKTTKTVKDIATGEVVQQLETVINDPAATEETKDTSEQDARKAAVKFINNISQDDEFGQTSIDGKEVVRGVGSGNKGGADDKGGGDKEDGTGFLSRVTNFFQENFSDLIDSDKLMNAALLYVGSRALGHSHAGSLNFVGRAYLGEIQKKLKVADQAALSNKYTKESVKKYRDTGKVEDLQLKPTTFQDQEVRSYVNRMGEQFNVITQKSSDGKVRHVDSRTGKVIPSLGKLTLQTDFDSNQAKARTMIENNLKSQFNAMIPKDERDEFASRIATPESVASLMAVKFAAMGISPSKGGEIMNRVYRNMINDVKNGVEDSLIDEAAALPYINKQIMEASMKEFGIAEMFEGASSEAVETALGFNLKGSDPLQVKQEADDLATLWKTLTPEGVKYYKGRAVEGKPAIIILAEEVNSGQANKDFFKKPNKD